MAAEELDKMTVFTELSNQGKSKSSFFRLFLLSACLRTDGCLLLRLAEICQEKMLQAAALLETRHPIDKLKVYKVKV